MTDGSEYKAVAEEMARARKFLSGLTTQQKEEVFAAYPVHYPNGERNAVTSASDYLRARDRQKAEGGENEAV